MIKIIFMCSAEAAIGKGCILERVLFLELVICVLL
jgi:hypothetical protein